MATNAPLEAELRRRGMNGADLAREIGWSEAAISRARRRNYCAQSLKWAIYEWSAGRVPLESWAPPQKAER